MLPTYIAQFVGEFVPLTICHIWLDRKYAGRPVMPSFITTVIAITAMWQFWWKTPSLDFDDLRLATDDAASAVIVLALAYMFADMVLLLFFSKSSLHDRVMFFGHHLFGSSAMVSSLYYGVYSRMVLFYLTSEVTNIFLNGADLLPPKLVYVLCTL